MTTISPTETVTVEEVVYQVADLPDTVKQKVAIYDVWRQDNEDLRNEIIKCDAAMREFGAQIARDIQQANDEVESEDDVIVAAPKDVTE